MVQLLITENRWIYNTHCAHYSEKNLHDTQLVKTANRRMHADTHTHGYETGTQAESVVSLTQNRDISHWTSINQ